MYKFLFLFSLLAFESSAVAEKVGDAPIHSYTYRDLTRLPAPAREPRWHFRGNISDPKKLDSQAAPHNDEELNKILATARTEGIEEQAFCALVLELEKIILDRKVTYGVYWPPYIPVRVINMSFRKEEGREIVAECDIMQSSSIDGPACSRFCATSKNQAVPKERDFAGKIEISEPVENIRGT